MAISLLSEPTATRNHDTSAAHCDHRATERPVHTWQPTFMRTTSIHARIFRPTCPDESAFSRRDTNPVSIAHHCALLPREHGERPQDPSLRLSSQGRHLRVRKQRTIQSPPGLAAGWWLDGRYP